MIFFRRACVEVRLIRFEPKHFPAVGASHLGAFAKNAVHAFAESVVIGWARGAAFARFAVL